MCGIIGYVGKQKAAPIIIDGLKSLEYRGYDSAGLAVLCTDCPGEIVAARKASPLVLGVGEQPKNSQRGQDVFNLKTARSVRRANGPA